MRPKLKWYLDRTLSTALALLGVSIVIVGQRSSAMARNNSSRWDEECWFEGCDNEEREEMYDAGSFHTEGNEFSPNNNKTGFQAAFETAELGAPDEQGSVAWGYCALMLDDFDKKISKFTSNVVLFRADCNNRWSNNWGRPH